MSVMLLRYHVDESDVQSVIDAIASAFAALNREGTDALRFTYYRVEGTSEFLAVLELPDGAENPLPKLEAMRKLKAVVDRVAVGAAPLPRPLEVLGSYEPSERSVPRR